jgi:hypothetical protein
MGRKKQQKTEEGKEMRYKGKRKKVKGKSKKREC